MIGHWPADRPGDKTLAALILARPELATLDAAALHVREAVKAG